MDCASLYQLKPAIAIVDQGEIGIHMLIHQSQDQNTQYLQDFQSQVLGIPLFCELIMTNVPSGTQSWQDNRDLGLLVSCPV